MIPEKIAILRGISFILNNFLNYNRNAKSIIPKNTPCDMSTHHKAQRDRPIIERMVQETCYIKFKWQNPRLSLACLFLEGSGWVLMEIQHLYILLKPLLVFFHNINNNFEQNNTKNVDCVMIFGKYNLIYSCHTPHFGG